MDFILVLFLFGSLGPQTELAPFETEEECIEQRDKFRGIIAEHNAEKDSEKIMFYAAACLPIQRAPQGKEI